ncbi:MAG: response regulator, partial [Deltaproteobacteria bacterium]|nr:response regulator [Deltaproteobacteria bacterium]
MAVLDVDKPGPVLYLLPATLGAVFGYLVWHVLLLRDRLTESVKEVEAGAAEVEALNRQLALNLDVKTHALEQAESQLLQAQKLDAVGRLSGGIAHDFNNMLTAITGNVELILLDIAEHPEIRESAEEIQKAAEQAAELTGQLLTFSRKQVIAPEVIDLNRGVDRLRSMLRRLIGENIELQIATEGDLGWVSADPSQVEQIILNLAINARDAMPDGGKMIIETANVTMTDEDCLNLAGAKPGPYVMLAVSDSGIGMDAETRAKIFDPFFTTKELGLGTGLGLATVHGILGQHGGSIEVESEPGKGTTIKAYFHRVRDEATPVSKPKRSTRRGGQETVLIAEDDDMVRTLAVRLLDNLGYEVLAASSGADALSIAESHEGPIALLLTDVVMPRMNGRDLAEKLVAARPEIQVLYTSGYTHDVISHHGVIDEGIHFVAKPYSLDVLAARVREVIDEK